MPALIILLAMVITMAPQAAFGATAEELAAEQALFDSIKIKPDQLMPLRIDTDVVVDGQPTALICHANDPAWRSAAETVQKAVADATGVSLQVVTDAELTPEQADQTNLILLGHLDNNTLVARLYHNFFVCLDQGFTGRTGYVIRSVHDPFGTGHNSLLVGGSFAEGTARAAEAFAEMVKASAKGNSLSIGRQMTLVFDDTDRLEPTIAPLTDEARDSAIKRGHDTFSTPGTGRSGASQVISMGQRYQRTGDPLAGEAYRGLMLALRDYYAQDETINKGGLARYDNDFRDAWTYEVGILWDLHEECGLFSDEERLELTNLVLKLALECVVYQRYNRPDVFERWKNNQDIVHNHNTFPGLGVYFVGNYFKRHYNHPAVDDWLTVAHGIFRGLRHSSKPLEDAASYQWLPPEHLMTYSLAEGDTTFFDEGHAREMATVAMMVMDNAGYQSAFGDNSGLTGSSYIANTIQKVAWYHKDPTLLWGAQHATGNANHVLGQAYNFIAESVPPDSITGITISKLPKMCYDYIERSPARAVKPNLPWEQSFDKLTFRSGLDLTDDYMLLDGFGRGGHMHFDTNAIIRFAKGGRPLLVDGEYIKNLPKYHNSMVIMREGQGAFAPALAGLGRADQLNTAGYTRTWINDYNGAEWTRRIVWRPNDYFLVVDSVEALEAGNFTLRCCWRPWGNPVLEGNTLKATHQDLLLTIANADGAPGRLEKLRNIERMDISRYSQQVSVALAAQESYRFVNLVHAEPVDAARDISVKQVMGGLIVIERPEGIDAVALDPAPLRMMGLNTDAEMLRLSEDGIVIAGFTSFDVRGNGISASEPVALEVSPAKGDGVFEAGADTHITLKTGAGVTLQVGDRTVTANPQGDAQFDIPAGRTPVAFAEVASFAGVTEALGMIAAMPPIAPAQTGSAGDGSATLSQAWSFAGLEPRPQPLNVASVTADKPHAGRGPIEKACDGEYHGSTDSVSWRNGETVTLTAELERETFVKSVLLREWHMSETWDIGERRLQVSSDGFVNDIRDIPGEFTDEGRDVFGGNINTLMGLQVGQKARQLRLTLTPAREDSSVYLAEWEIHGTEVGAVPAITAVAGGDLLGDGTRHVVAAGEQGGLVALSADGAKLWEFETGDGARINSIACADVNGDGRDEVIYGANSERLGLVSADGAELWHVKPPQFRGIRADVITVFPADVTGDGVPEVICGCLNWMYFAYDKDGKMVWKNVIYAHSATVGHADDFDGDGKQEIIGGNAYYTLNIIDHDGVRLRSVSNFGPEQTAVSSTDVNGDGVPEVLIATDGGELICFDTTGQRLWENNLGDKVTRIIPVDLDGDGIMEIACAAESATVFALNLQGEIVWRTAVGDGVSEMALIAGDAPKLAVAAGAAGIVVLDGEGTIISRGAVDGRVESLALLNGQVVASTDSGTLVAFGL